LSAIGSVDDAVGPDDRERDLALREMKVVKVRTHDAKYD
jgi:hypothetical protein